MTSRYFVPDLPHAGGILDLPPAEAAHANRVMRVKPGDEVILFDGKNRESRATVISQTKRDCQCDALPAQLTSREPTVDICIAVALPRGDRTRFLIERLTELGVRQIVPLSAERSQGRPKRDLVDKLTRICIESCKQSGRNQLPEIRETTNSRIFFQEPCTANRIIAHPNQQTRSLPPDHAGRRAGWQEPHFRLAIGPEGGFTDGELDVAREYGFTPVSLGPRTYRIETAAIVITTLAIHLDSPL